MNLTDNERKAIQLTLNYDTLEDQLSDNYSNAGMKEIQEALGWNEHQVAGLIGSLTNKGLVIYEEEDDILWLTDEGVEEAFRVA